MKNTTQQTWTPRKVELPSQFEGQEVKEELSQTEYELAMDMLELRALFDEIDDLFSGVYGTLDEQLAKMAIIPDPSDSRLAHALVAFDSPGVITKDVVDKAMLVLSVPNGVIMNEVSTDTDGTPSFITSTSQTYKSCATYAQGIKDYLAGMAAPNTWAAEALSSNNSKLQELSRKKALKMIFLAVLEQIVELIAKMLRPLRWTPARPAVNKIISWLRKQVRDAQRKLFKIDPIGATRLAVNPTTRYEIWLKIKTIDWNNTSPVFGVDWELAMNTSSGLPYQPGTIPPTYVTSLLLEEGMDADGNKKKNVTSSYRGWTRMEGTVVVSESVFPINPLFPFIKAQYKEPLSIVVQQFVVDTTIQYMDQDTWVIKPLGTPATADDLDPDLNTTANECTANAMSILGAADLYHTGDSTLNGYPNQSYMMYRSLGSIKEGYDGTKAVTKSLFIATSELMTVVGGTDTAKWLEKAGKATEHGFGWVDKSLESVYNEYLDFVKQLNDEPVSPRQQLNNRYIKLGKSLPKLKKQTALYKAFLGDLKNFLLILAADLKNWINDRTILCCFIQNSAAIGLSWRPWIKLMLLIIAVLKNRGKALIKEFLGGLLDLGLLLYNTAVTVVVGILEMLAKSGIEWVQNWLEDRLALEKESSVMKCTPFKAFVFSLAGGLELFADDLLDYIRDMLLLQKRKIDKTKEINETCKFNDWLDHVARMLKALDHALSHQIICKDGIATDAKFSGYPGGPIIVGGDTNGPIGGGVIFDASIPSAQVIAARAYQQIATFGPTGPISAQDLVDFYSSYLHYTPDQISAAISSTDVQLNNMRQLGKLVPDLDAMAGIGTCTSNLTPEERAEVDARLAQIKSIEEVR